MVSHEQNERESFSNDLSPIQVSAMVLNSAPDIWGFLQVRWEECFYQIPFTQKSPDWYFLLMWVSQDIESPAAAQSLRFWKVFYKKLRKRDSKIRIRRKHEEDILQIVKCLKGFAQVLHWCICYFFTPENNKEKW